jgi:hypothetical protein
MHLNFSSRYAKLILRIWGPTIIFLLNNRNFGIFNDSVFWDQQLCILGPTIIWDIFFKLAHKGNPTYSGYVDPQRKFYLHWIEIWDLITGTAYRLYLLHPHIVSLFLRSIKIVDIAKNITQLLT